MNSTHHSMEHLDEDSCWALLRTTSVGRLAVDDGGRPDIFPVNFVVDGGTIVFRSGAGTKLAAAVLMRWVALEIDGFDYDDRTAWSVVVKGTASTVDGLDDVLAVESLRLEPWVDSAKPVFVRISARDVTGRRFHLSPGARLDRSLGQRSV
jgi:uncharacterized protein